MSDPTPTSPEPEPEPEPAPASDPAAMSIADFATISLQTARSSVLHNNEMNARVNAMKSVNYMLWATSIYDRANTSRMSTKLAELMRAYAKREFAYWVDAIVVLLINGIVVPNETTMNSYALRTRIMIAAAILNSTKTTKEHREAAIMHVYDAEFKPVCRDGKWEFQPVDTDTLNTMEKIHG